MNNLISNALDYTPAGGTITLSASVRDDFLRFEVKDTGRGIPKEQFDRIFEKFSQGQSGSSENKLRTWFDFLPYGGSGSWRTNLG